jgi:autophagy-related protein 2
MHPSESSHQVNLSSVSILCTAQPTLPDTVLIAEHVEIFPIELKLDYKPKRVDFTALREGKTIELMNFFHFDGAEMTLRHITISGVSLFLI